MVHRALGSRLANPSDLHQATRSVLTDYGTLDSPFRSLDGIRSFRQILTMFEIFKPETVFAVFWGTFNENTAALEFYGLPSTVPVPNYS